MTSQELSRLVDRYLPSLMLFARQWCDTPEDVVQDAFVKLVQQRVVPNDVPAWLYRVVRNAAIDASKMQRRRQIREAKVGSESRWFVEPEVDGLDADQAVKRLRELPLDQREVIVAHLWGGLSFEQIAETVGCSTSTAFRRYSAGIETLRQRLGEGVRQ